MTRYQCLQYVMDRPGVLVALPGIRNMEDLNALIGFADAPDSEKDYSVIGQFTPTAAQGNCVYWNHCQPCPFRTAQSDRMKEIAAYFSEKE